MERKELEKIVDDCFDKELAGIQGKMSMELYPAAFANEYSWLHVKAAIDLNNQAIRRAMKSAIAQVLEQNKL